MESLSVSYDHVIMESEKKNSIYRTETLVNLHFYIRY